MDCIKLYFNGILQNQIKLEIDWLTVGRAEDNDICIGNPGVSAHHAVIKKEGGTFIVEDLNSKNGTYVNDKKISRVPLSYGDTISIFKHELQFSPWIQSIHPDTANSGVYQSDACHTVQVDRSQIDAVLERHRSNQPKAREEAGSHLLLTQGSRTTKFPLNKPFFAIGKSPECDFQIKGWFAPKMAAKLTRVGTDYFIYPLNGGKIFVNGQRIKQPSKLYKGDDIAIRKLQLRYLP